MNRIAYILLSLSIFALFGCREGDENYRMLTYEELPKNVKRTFNDIYSYEQENLPPFSDCANVNPSISCKVEYKYSNGLVTLIIPQQFLVKSDGRVAEIPFSTLERIFVVKNDSVYYPYTRHGGVIAYGEPRSAYIKIDTLIFRVKEMTPQ